MITLTWWQFLLSVLIAAWFLVWSRRFGMTLLDFATGLHYGYPICCIRQYSWRSLWNREPALVQAWIYGRDFLTRFVNEFGYVPCDTHARLWKDIWAKQEKVAE